MRGIKEVASMGHWLHNENVKFIDLQLGTIANCLSFVQMSFVINKDSYSDFVGYIFTIPLPIN